MRQGEAAKFFYDFLKQFQNAGMVLSEIRFAGRACRPGLQCVESRRMPACSLLPETSCTMSNRLLDRALLTGSSDSEFPAYFSDLLG